MALQSAFQEKCSYTMAVRGLLGEGSVTVHRMRAFAVHGAYIGTLGLMECKKYVLYVIRKR